MELRDEAIDAVIKEMIDRDWVQPDFFEARRKCRCGRILGVEEDFRQSVRDDVRDFITIAVEWET